MIRLLTALFEHVRAMPKMRRFAVYLAMVAVAASVVSLLTYVTVYRNPGARPVTIAVVTPLSGAQAAQGLALRQGAERFVAHQLQANPSRPVQLLVLDEADPQAIAKAAANPSVVAMVGPLQARPQDEAALAAARLPRLTLSGPSGQGEIAADAWSLPLSADPAYEARFLANYVRNVIGEKLVSIILPDSPDQAAIATAFDETLQRFGTRVVYRWAVPADPAARGAALAAAAREIESRQVAGSILVLGDADFAADTVAELGAAHLPNRVIGLRDFGTNAFHTRLSQVWHSAASLPAALNQTLFTTPVLFDTAGAEAQDFKSAFRAQTGTQPDWISVLAYDAAATVARLIAEAPASAPGAELRETLHTALLAHRSAETALPGLAAPIFFETRSGSAIPTLIGRFDGQQIIAAQTQLWPIRDEGVQNYLEQLSGGKALYVVDRFMYKTNVVAAGMRMGKVVDINTDTNIAELEVMLWFRWRGSFSPNDVVFENAATPITLGTADRSVDDGDEHYRAWRVRGKFFMNVSSLQHPYGTQLVTVAMRHRTLGRNNLMYVDDVVGMDLEGPGRIQDSRQSVLAHWLGLEPDTGSALAAQLEANRVLAGVPGWVIDRALFSQDVTRAGSDGDPNFVGFGKPAPLFSRVAMDVQIKPDAIDLRGLLPEALLVYLAIFAAGGALLAHLLDRRDRGHIWRMQTLILRVVTWPLLLATLSALALDYALANLGLGEVQAIDFLARALWWIMPARLLTMTIERFVWAPLEARTGRRVPTVFRMSVSLLIYILAGFGVVSFVLGRTITSLLATSGLVTLIFGLAVQSNIKDIFSGVMLNLERPFVLGDWIRINRRVVQVHDISWRTTRLRTKHGQIISLSNGKMVDAEIENLTAAGMYAQTLSLLMDPRCPPDQVMAACKRATAKFTAVPHKLYKIVLRGIESYGGPFAAHYSIDILVTDYNLCSKVSDGLWPLVWQELVEAGLSWALVPHRVDDAAGEAVSLPGAQAGVLG